jgi:hypothetical protein
MDGVPVRQHFRVNRLLPATLLCRIDLLTSADTPESSSSTCRLVADLARLSYDQLLPPGSMLAPAGREGRHLTLVWNEVRVFIHLWAFWKRPARCACTSFRIPWGVGNNVFRETDTVTIRENPPPGFCTAIDFTHCKRPPSPVWIYDLCLKEVLDLGGEGCSHTGSICRMQPLLFGY